MNRYAHLRTGVTLLALLFVLVGSQAIAANSDFGLKGIGLRLGYVDPEADYSGTVLFGAVADMGAVGNNLHAEASVTYWKSDWNYGYNWIGYSESWTISLSDIAIRGGLRYHFPQEGWAPYAGGGLGVHFYTASWETPSGEASWSYSGADGTRFGVYICGGAEAELSESLLGSAELMMNFSEVGQTGFQANLVYLLK